jgi:hypothetical protein
MSHANLLGIRNTHAGYPLRSRIYRVSRLGLVSPQMHNEWVQRSETHRSGANLLLADANRWVPLRCTRPTDCILGLRE